MTPSITIRPAHVQDLPFLMEMFRQTIEIVCAPDYTPEQRKAWIDRGMNKERWLGRLNTQLFLVAQAGNQLAGFGSLEHNSYIDLMYVHKDWQGKGIARALLQALEQRARSNQVKGLTSDVSKTAMPFFQQMGFQVLSEQTLELSGVTLSNFKMEKIL